MPHLFLLGLSKQLAEQFFGLDSPLFGQGDRLVLVDGIADVAFLVKAIQGIPIVAFPSGGPKLVVAPGQVEQSENRFIHFVRIKVHWLFPSILSTPLFFASALLLRAVFRRNLTDARFVQRATPDVDQILRFLDLVGMRVKGFRKLLRSQKVPDTFSFFST
jgi:hypothetical protein